MSIFKISPSQKCLVKILGHLCYQSKLLESDIILNVETSNAVFNQFCPGKIQFNKKNGAYARIQATFS